MSDKEATTEPTQPEESSSRRVAVVRTLNWPMVAIASVFGVVIGGLVAWALLNIGGPGVGFLIAATGSGYVLYQKPTPLAAVGSGLYAIALILVLVPISFYIPVVLGADGGASGAGEFVGGLVGLLVWGFVFLLIGLVTFVIGYFVNKRARRQIDEKDA